MTKLFLIIEEHRLDFRGHGSSPSVRCGASVLAPEPLPAPHAAEFCLLTCTTARSQEPYHCHGGDTLLGSASVGASIFLLLLLGWVVGTLLTTALFLLRDRRRARREARLGFYFLGGMRVNV